MKKTTLPKIAITRPVTGEAMRGIGSVHCLGDGVEVLIFAASKEDLEYALRRFLIGPHDPRKFAPLLIVLDR